MFVRHSPRAASIVLILGIVTLSASASGVQISQTPEQAPGQIDLARQIGLSITVIPPGQEPTINVSKISAGGVVVGSAPPQGNVLRWLPGATAPENLGGAPAYTILNRLPLISADGGTIAASRRVPDATGMSVGVPGTWTAQAGWVALSGLTLRSSFLVGMSRNGTRITGYGWNDSSVERARPWVWSAEQGQQVLPLILPTYGGEAWAASDDGRVVVGHQFDFPNLPDPRRRFYATRWADGNMRALLDGRGAQLGQAYSCSSDCSVVVGGGQGGDADPGHPNFGQAWYWTEAEGGVYLGTVPDAAPGTTSYGTDVNGDGSIIVGTYYRLNDNGSISYRGFLWTRLTGMVPILDLMAMFGIDYASDWRSVVPTAITPSGNMILIGGQDANLTPGGFILHLSVPGMTTSADR